MAQRRSAVELVGSREIADRLGLAQPESVHTWRRRYKDFPAPVARLGIGFVWRWADVEAWADKTDRTVSDKEGAR
jgi:predicted DNA-binding transcriptional regulator AlpA